MLAVIKENEIYFPLYMVNSHNQGTKHSRDRYYRDFTFIVFNDAGNLPVIHNYLFSVRGRTLNTKRMLLGINIDSMGGVNKIMVEPTITNNDDEDLSGKIVSIPKYMPIEIPVRNDEWNIVADYPALHDYCAGLLHIGESPAKAISMTLMAMGHPNAADVASINLNEAKKKISKRYKPDDETTEEAFIANLLQTTFQKADKEGK